MQKSNLELVDGHWQYARSWHQQQVLAESMLAKEYNCNKCLLAPSGTAAIAIALESLIVAKEIRQISMANELYSGTHKLIYALGITHNLLVTEFHQQAVPESFPPNTLVFAETISNPSGWRLDLDAMTRAQPAILVLDNTWATHHVVTIPWPCTLANQMDVYTVLSLSKHYSSGQTILGAILGNDLSIPASYARLRGNHVDPAACSIVTQTIPLMHTRIKNAADVAQRVVTYMRGEGIEVEYCPGCTTISFLTNCNMNKAKKRMKDSGVDYKTSFGTSTARFDTFPVKNTSGSTWCRLALGYEDNHAVTNEMLLTFR